MLLSIPLQRRVIIFQYLPPPIDKVSMDRMDRKKYLQNFLQLLISRSKVIDKHRVYTQGPIGPVACFSSSESEFTNTG